MAWRRVKDWSGLRGVVVACVGVLTFGAGGCQIGQLIGGMAQSAQLNSSTTFPAEYTGLEGKTWAVLVTSPRSLQAEFSDMVGKLTTAITNQIASQVEQTGYAGFQPSSAVQRFAYESPRWTSWEYREVAERLSVDRVILIEVTEMRLTEPGNQYTWDGLIQARVGVIEADGGAPNEFAFVRDFSLQFPDDRGYTVSDMPREAVREQLYYRLATRVAWLFQEYERPNRQEW